MAGSGTHPLHTRSWHPDIQGHTAKSKAKRTRNVGLLLDAYHGSKWNQVSYCDPFLPNPTQLLYASLVSSHSLLTISCRVNSQLNGISIQSLLAKKSHLKRKARTEYSEGYLKWCPCKSHPSLLCAGFLIFKTFIPLYVMRTRWPTEMVHVDGSKDNACIYWSPCSGNYMFMCEKLADVGMGAPRGGQASCARCRRSRAFRADQGRKYWQWSGCIWAMLWVPQSKITGIDCCMRPSIAIEFYKYEVPPSGLKLCNISFLSFFFLCHFW